MQIIGVAGMPGAGRSTLAHALATNRRWTLLSLAGLLAEEATRHGLKPSRRLLADVSEQIRHAEGDGALIERAVARFHHDPQPGRGRGLVVYNLHRAAEADAIHALIGRVIWIEAAPVVRAKRLGIEDPATVRIVPEELALVSHRADVFCENNGDDITRFRQTSRRVLDDDNCCAVEFD